MGDWIQLLGGGLLLYLGAEWFVTGASSLALALRIPQLLVGLTVVAYGTSAPEIIVGIQAAAGGHGDVALGNVIGSNVANVGLILGLVALIQPPRVAGDLRRRELPVLLASTALLPMLLIDGTISRADGVLLVSVALLYTGWMIRSARRASAIVSAAAGAQAAATAADLAGAPEPKKGAPRAAAIAVAGLVILLLGGHVFIEGAISVARALGASDRLVGLTIVAVGTSLPELVTSLIAARRGQSDLAVGNVVGSNIFNALLCLGASGLAGAISGSLSELSVDLVALMVMTLLVAVSLRRERIMSRAEGGLALLLYVAFVALTVARG
ncbi:MAG: hypothetical protein RL685_99 [Pseudomonadota bacterium]